MFLICGHINRHRDNAFCNSCDKELLAPAGYIGIPEGYTRLYLLCECCFNRGWYKHDRSLAKKRALIWWITDDEQDLWEIKI